MSLSQRLSERVRGLMPRFLHSRPHLAIAVAIGIAVACLLPERIEPVQRALGGWVGIVYTYLLLAGYTVMGADAERVRESAGRQDENAGMILAALCLATILSITAIVAELGNVNNVAQAERAWRYIFTAVTIFGSWFMVGLLFCIHYAHLYYLSDQEKRAFNFPEQNEEPDYWDFLYFSFTIAVAAQTSDVAVMNRHVRRLVLAQSVLSFFFNITILGLTVNMGASLINH
jgi:uncharacterized membrane protein